MTVHNEMFSQKQNNNFITISLQGIVSKNWIKEKNQKRKKWTETTHITSNKTEVQIFLFDSFGQLLLVF